MNQNWIVENLNNAFSTWNGKLTELWGLVTTSPQSFKGGAVWGVMQSLAQYPQQLDDKFIATLLQQAPYIVLSIAIQPVETEDAYREIEDSRMKTDAEKVRFNRKTVENLDFVALCHTRHSTGEEHRIYPNGNGRA